MSYWYIASPYSAHPDGLEVAHGQAVDFLARCLTAGLPVFSPIAHTHAAGDRVPAGAVDHGFWLNADKPLADAAMGLIVLCLPGWDRSVGVEAEREWFRVTGRPIVFVDPSSEADWRALLDFHRDRAAA